MELLKDTNNIFKYIPFSINSLKILIKGELWLGYPESLNDPFEGDFTIENINFENEIVQGVKEICAKMKTEYSFSTSKPFYYKTRGQTGEEIEFKLNPSDKYFFESIEFIVIEGPYKSWPYNLALTYQVKFTHISVNENIDPELEARALNFLKNLEVTVDWEKEVVE